VHGKTPVSSGITAVTDGTAESRDFDEQTTTVLQRISELLQAEQLGVEDVVSTQVFLSTMDYFDRMNHHYAAHFRPPYPARASTANGLYPGVLIEIAFIAELR
jgi:2-iminobutanoate/2-iminopropanoate deaminase